MGFFTGFAPTSKSAIFSRQVFTSTTSEFSPQPVELLQQSKTESGNFNGSLLDQTSISHDTEKNARIMEEEEEEEAEVIPRRLVIIVTPTSKKDPLRVVLLRRLANTLKLVPPPLLWVVVEQQSDSSQVSEILRKTGIMYRHLVFKENFTDIQIEMDHQRNVALNHIEHHRLSGIAHFAGLNNVYDLGFFDEIRATEVFGTWPMAFLSANRQRVKIEGPVCDSSEVIGWHLNKMNNQTDARSPVHISSFAFNSSILWDPERWGRPSSIQDTSRSQNSLKFVKKEVLDEETKLKGIPAEGCSKIMLWNLKTPIGTTTTNHLPGGTRKKLSEIRETSFTGIFQGNLRNDTKMGRKGSCFSSLKKALSPGSKEKKDKEGNKLKNLFGKEKASVPDSSTLETVSVFYPLPQPEEVKLTEAENEQTKHAYSVAVATAAAAEAAVAAAQAAAEVVRLTAVAQFTGKSEDEVAAIKIQTAFRGYLARRALRALRGLVRLKSLIEGPTVKRQTTNALQCMQTLSRIQSQITSRRIRMLEENRALQRHLLQKRVKELDTLKIGEEWDDSLQSKERIEANLLTKYEAAMRRERALAYSFSHQHAWKKSSRSANILFMDPTNPNWGWSWLERWMATRPWETPSMTEKELNNDQSSVKSARLSIAGGEITRAYARHQLNSDKPSPVASQKRSFSSNHRSPSTPPSKAAPSIAARKLKPPSPRASELSQDDDSKSMFSVQSERNRRHSIAGSSVRDDESLASSPSVPSYMAPTHSAKAKLRLQSPFGVENGTPEKGSAGSAKKRLSFPPSPARPRRHSGPPKVDTSSIVDSKEKNGGVI
ncbi:unnamed protein product [Ilex paraguariensis]|uniref:Glycosyltransferases n=1 Tax=Ilex paraguariensis TaxID=185542 RepID=A0ABC8SCL5_9AQUA